MPKTKNKAIDTRIDFSDVQSLLERMKWDEMDSPNNKLTIGCDLETVPNMGQYPELLNLPTKEEIEVTVLAKAKGGNRRKPETIVKWMAENRDSVRDQMVAERENQNQNLVKEWKRGALSSHEGTVVIIGFAFPGYPPTSLFLGGELKTERDLICAFDWVLDFAYVKFQKIRLMGHNIKGFDALWLSRLAVKYECHQVMRAVSLISPADTCEMWQMTSRDFKERKGLDAIAEYLGFGGKIVLEDEVCDVLGLESGSTMHGSLVSDLWRCGGVETLRRYCEGDVAITRAIFERIERVKGYARSRVA